MTKKEDVLPRRGEVWLVNFNPGRGSEQKGTRPALVLQNDIGNKFAMTTIIAAITTTIKPYPIAVVCEKGEGGLPQKSMVNLAQLLTIDKKRLLKSLGRISPSKLHEIDQALLRSLGLTEPH